MTDRHDEGNDIELDLIQASDGVMVVYNPNDNPPDFERMMVVHHGRPLDEEAHRQVMGAQRGALSQDQEVINITSRLRLISGIMSFLSCICSAALQFRPEAQERQVIQSLFVLGIVFGAGTMVMTMCIETTLSSHPSRLTRIRNLLWVAYGSATGSFIMSLAGVLVQQWNRADGWSSNVAVIVSVIYLLIILVTLVNNHFRQ